MNPDHTSFILGLFTTEPSKIPLIAIALGFHTVCGGGFTNVENEYTSVSDSVSMTTNANEQISFVGGFKPVVSRSMAAMSI
jgi:hypothetical protein